MARLLPMRSAHFEVFAEEAIAAYADDNVQSLRWAAVGALERAQQAFARLLPQGTATPHHGLCEIVTEAGPTVRAGDADGDADGATAARGKAGGEGAEGHAYEAGGGETVGHLWYAFDPAAEEATLYLYNILVYPRFRGRGHAKAALEALQQRARQLGARSIGLHVFAHNPTAQALYRAMGYGITGFNMVKRLDRL